MLGRPPSVTTTRVTFISRCLRGMLVQGTAIPNGQPWLSFPAVCAGCWAQTERTYLLDGFHFPLSARAVGVFFVFRRLNWHFHFPLSARAVGFRHSSIGNCGRLSFPAVCAGCWLHRYNLTHRALLSFPAVCAGCWDGSCSDWQRLARFHFPLSARAVGKAHGRQQGLYQLSFPAVCAGCWFGL